MEGSDVDVFVTVEASGAGGSTFDASFAVRAVPKFSDDVLGRAPGFTVPTRVYPGKHNKTLLFSLPG